MRKLQSNSIPSHALGLFALLLGLLAAAPAQQTSSPADDSQPKIRVNFLNPCSPAPADLEAMRRALAHVKETPRFSPDFEIARGLTTLTEAEALAAGVPTNSEAVPSAWVRIRREFPDKAPLTDVQYSLSVDDGSVSESLALHLRDSREVLEILISDTVKGSATQVVRADTPPDRIRIERFGKPSIVLARCGSVDQSSYEPLFQTADGIFQRYRAAMEVKTTVPAELAHLPAGRESGHRASGGKRSAGAGH